jgi:hypothetical protein
MSDESTYRDRDVPDVPGTDASDALPASLRAAVDALREPAPRAPDALARATVAALAAQRAAVSPAGARPATIRRRAVTWAMAAAAAIAAVGLGTGVWRARGTAAGGEATIAAARPTAEAPAVASPAAPMLPAAAGTAALDEAPRPVRFTLRAPGARQVAVVGDFNRWDPAATPLARGTGAWEVEVPLAPGRHAYAFVVDGSRWVLDPAAPSERDPDFGRPRSVTVVGLEVAP